MDDKNKTTEHVHGQKHTSTRGGTPEQHASAGRKGGLAPHKCRGRGCSKKKTEQ